VLVTSEKELAFKMGKPQQVRNKRTGVMETVYPGIDPGFAYNPGVARLERLKALAEAERAFEAMAQGAGPKDLRPPKGPQIDARFRKSSAWRAAKTEEVRDDVARTWVVAQQAATGNEHAVVFEVGGRLLQANGGIEDAVWAIWKKKFVSSSQVRVHHSHPRPGGLSHGDFASNWVSCKAVTISAHDSAGSSFTGKALLPPESWSAVHRAIFARASKRLAALHAPIGLADHAACLALERKGFISYSALLSDTTKRSIQALGDEWDGLIAKLVAVMEA
jgi:hypothetical protein